MDERDKQMSDTTERTFDRIPQFDERSRNFPVRALLASSVRRRNKTWKTANPTDQGREGACVGHGWTTEALSTPIRVDLNRLKAQTPRIPDEFAQFVYKAAQKIDPWEGEDYSGTSVLAGVKVLQSLGLVKEYRWCFSTDDVVDTVLSKGPVVLGIKWFSGMYSAPDGVLSVSGNVVGGHCITAVGYRVASPKLNGEDGVLLQNSWGADWGVNGQALIRLSELDRLLQDQGEACVPTKRGYGR